jgi:pimeloyl-ACP methyl ester carboxylesterase
VLLPGSGSDAEFVAEAFAEPLAAVGVRLLAPPPRPGAGVVERMRADLDRAAARHGPVLAGGVSLGAQVAASWAVDCPGRCAGLLVALPAWIGEPGRAPAAEAARASADLVAAAGVEAALAHARSGSPPWIADELDRAWRRYGRALADSLRAAATTAAPTLGQLRRLQIPVGVVGLADDPVHPLEVARAWAGAPRSAAMVTLPLDAVGRDRQALGRAAVLAWLRARTQQR